MSDSSVALSESLLEDVPPSAPRHVKVLMLLSLLVVVLLELSVPPASGLRPTVETNAAPAQELAVPKAEQASGVKPLQRLGLSPATSRRSVMFQTLTAAAASAGESGLKMPSPVLKAASAVVTPVLSPLYSVEAPLQASLTGVAGGPSAEEVQAKISSTLQSNACVVYSYPLSPFCSEAVALLESTGCQCEVVEPGQEWFLLGPEGSLLRSELGKMTGQTSFPHVFIKGQSVGGLFSGGEAGGGIAGLAESGDLVPMLKKAGACGSSGSGSGPLGGLFSR